MVATPFAFESTTGPACPTRRRVSFAEASLDLDRVAVEHRAEYRDFPPRVARLQDVDIGPVVEALDVADLHGLGLGLPRRKRRRTQGGADEGHNPTLHHSAPSFAIRCGRGAPLLVRRRLEDPSPPEPSYVPRHQDRRAPEIVHKSADCRNRQIQHRAGLESIEKRKHQHEKKRAESGRGDDWAQEQCQKRGDDDHGKADRDAEGRREFPRRPVLGEGLDRIDDHQRARHHAERGVVAVAAALEASADHDDPAFDPGRRRIWVAREPQDAPGALRRAASRRRRRRRASRRSDPVRPHRASTRRDRSPACSRRRLRSGSGDRAARSRASPPARHWRADNPRA